MKKSYLQRPFRLGKAVLPSNVFYSPLAGCSDLPFREMAASYSPGLIYCEMVKMDALVRGDRNTFRILDYRPDMHPIGAQLVGSKADVAREAARIIEDLGFDVLDLNCGCPVDKVTKDGSGSGMLKDPRRIADVLSAMVNAVDIPVTVKIRTGWSESEINAADITLLAEEVGAEAIAIHGRTRVQAYKGPANWQHIADCKKVATRIKVIGNGDVFDAPAAERMFQETNCDAVLVSRGTMGSPWIADDIYRHLEGRPAIDRSPEDCRQALLEHFRRTVAYHPPRKVVIEMRRVGCWYIKRSAGTKEFRARMSKAESLKEVEDLIETFEFA